jgi:hypothetical protein
MAIWPLLPYKNWLRGQGKAIKTSVRRTKELQLIDRTRSYLKLRLALRAI